MDSDVLGAVVAKSMGDVDAAGGAPGVTTKKKDETKGTGVEKKIARALVVFIIIMWLYVCVYMCV